jgi:tRNA G37 N-methylase TrmD
LKNVFFVEKFAEKNQCKTFHCFAQDSYHEHTKGLDVLPEYTIKNCWGQFNKPSLAPDGEHYGVEHHKRFAKLFVDYFGKKLK